MLQLGVRVVSKGSKISIKSGQLRCFDKVLSLVIKADTGVKYALNFDNSNHVWKPGVLPTKLELWDGPEKCSNHGKVLELVCELHKHKAFKKGKAVEICAYWRRGYVLNKEMSLTNSCHYDQEFLSRSSEFDLNFEYKWISKLRPTGIHGTNPVFVIYNTSWDTIGNEDGLFQRSKTGIHELENMCGGLTFEVLAAPLKINYNFSFHLEDKMELYGGSNSKYGGLFTNTDKRKLMNMEDDDKKDKNSFSKDVRVYLCKEYMFTWTHLAVIYFFEFKSEKRLGICQGSQLAPESSTNSVTLFWLVFDRGKKNRISGYVMTIMLLDLKMCFLQAAKKRDVQMLFLVKGFPKVPLETEAKDQFQNKQATKFRGLRVGDQSMVIICFVMGVCKYGWEEGKVQANPITNKLRFASYYVFKLCFDTFHGICRTHVMLPANKSMENYVIGKADECVSNVAMGQVNSIDEDKFVGFIESSDLLLARIFWLLILENIARLYLLKTHLKQAEKYKETTYVLVETSFNGAKVDCNTSMLVLEFQNLSFIGGKLQLLVLGLRMKTITLQGKLILGLLMTS